MECGRSTSTTCSSRAWTNEPESCRLNPRVWNGKTMVTRLPEDPPAGYEVSTIIPVCFVKEHPGHSGEGGTAASGSRRCVLRETRSPALQPRERLVQRGERVRRQVDRRRA